jgi:hypothetical protein
MGGQYSPCGKLETRCRSHRGSGSFPRVAGHYRARPQARYQRYASLFSLCLRNKEVLGGADAPDFQSECDLPSAYPAGYIAGVGAKLGVDWLLCPSRAAHATELVAILSGKGG